MALYYFISIVSFAVIAKIVAGNVVRVRSGDADMMVPEISLHDVMSQTYRYVCHELMLFARKVADRAMHLSHQISIFLAHRFLRFARIVKGKRELPQNRGSVTLIWPFSSRDRRE